MVSHSEPPNPYVSSSDAQIHPDTISFDGIVDESMYLSLVPRMDKFIVLPLALIIGLVVIPISILCLGFSVFIEPQLEMVAGSIVLLATMIAALIFCIRISAVRRRTISYLARSPDLLGRMQGIFSEKGLLLCDDEKTHWFPWVQLSRMAVSNAGIRVPLGDNPRRFLALGSNLFNSFRPSEFRSMLSKNRVSRITVEQLITESANAFDQTMESSYFYRGFVEQSISWKKKLMTVLIGPALGIGVVIWLALFSPDDQWTRVLVIAMAVYLLIPPFFELRKLARGRFVVTSQQWGWLTTDELIAGSGVHVIKIPLTLMQCTAPNTETLNFILPRGTSLPVFRSHFRDTTTFDRMSERTKARPTDCPDDPDIE